MTVCVRLCNRTPFPPPPLGSTSTYSHLVNVLAKGNLSFTHGMGPSLLPSLPPSLPHTDPIAQYPHPRGHGNLCQRGAPFQPEDFCRPKSVTFTSRRYPQKLDWSYYLSWAPLPLLRSNKKRGKLAHSVSYRRLH